MSNLLKKFTICVTAQYNFIREEDPKAPQVLIVGDADKGFDSEAEAEAHLEKWAAKNPGQRAFIIPMYIAK